MLQHLCSETGEEDVVEQWESTVSGTLTDFTAMDFKSNDRNVIEVKTFTQGSFKGFYKSTSLTVY